MCEHESLQDPDYQKYALKIKRFDFWNTRSLKTTETLKTINRECDKYNLDILTVAETRLDQQKINGEETLITSTKFDEGRNGVY